MKKYILPSIDKDFETIILADGEFPSHPFTLSILNNCKYLVCCDGAVNNLDKISKQPDAIIGDCDSLSTENRNRFANIIHYIPDQETNDLTKAVHYCINQGRNNITILGATGKREDHTIANISLLCEYMEDITVEMITNYGVFTPIRKTSVFESRPKQQVSIFCIDQSPITSYHLLYPIENKVFTNWWQATLNEAEGNEFTIKTSGRTIIYRAFL
ncbi:MAG: thiamine diphosphokinase [Dysgonomonas sp.]|nr:thiamine diphosphokinase [Dysgonomonas sp.]